MQFYDELIKEWGQLADIPITPGARQTCRVVFPEDLVTLQIDLDRTGDRLLIGSVLGIINPGPYRKKLFLYALKTNTLSNSLRGILAFSQKLGSLVLFQYLSMANIDARKLDDCLKLFREHAKAWTHAMKEGDVPVLEEGLKQTVDSRMFGLKT